MKTKALVERVIEDFLEFRKLGVSADDAKASVILKYANESVVDSKIPIQKMASFVASIFGGFIGNGFTFDESREIFREALKAIDAQEDILRSMELNLKGLRTNGGKS